ncbi:DUF805 domain-containing protein [Stenotrophomonas indicatrix]|uniref:DUF805 domain-containing protein n=1 Tax=Stenotrophomonas indicatrix TaxID=2045451 RepID=UPI0037337CD0
MFQLFMLLVWAVLMAPWLATLVPVIADTVHRLHDCDPSGWLCRLAFIPFDSLVIFMFTLLPGTPEEGSYGPVPPALG